jgi:hypothetical protein
MSFAPLLLALAAAGLFLVLRREAARTILSAWILAYALLLLGRGLVPGVFQFQHEALFVAPLLYLAAGHAVAWLWSKGGWGRAGAGVLALALVVQGLLTQREALLGQLGHAR